jgi:HD-GYP domain-containing protein (c-di-GMP phosphodiesterase class II)
LAEQFSKAFLQGDETLAKSDGRLSHELNCMRNPALNCIPETSPLRSIARTLTVALGQRDHHTRAHSDRVVQLSAGLGYHIGLTEDEIELLSLGAQFHDIGKIGIPDRVLHKPASFEEEEWACMKQHAEIGERIILAIDGDKASKVAKTVRHHHEHFDGSGYPDCLVGTSIPLYARIISLADSYDAMIDTRSYQRGRSHPSVMNILERESGIKHDPDLLHAFKSAIEKSALRGKEN